MTDKLERALRRSLSVIEDLEARLASREDDLAVIGLACRFPGAADSEAYWALLRDGVDAVRDIPADRWDVDRYFHPDPRHPGTMYTRRGGFVDDVFGFDHALFGMSPRESARTDPQHRLLLEVAWEAIEHAGIAPSSLRGSDTGVFLGIAENDYAKVVDDDNARRGRVDPYDSTGTGACFASGRLSHVLGLHGPNLAIDTGCSSALVALHHAASALRAGECGAALVAGVHLRLAPETTLALSATSALAPDGRCKPFGAAADGFGRSEGVGVVLLKRLADAVRDDDPVLAVVRGSAVNHDGPASGLTAPSEKAQTMLVRAALEAARVDARDVGVVEAHGTGTILGDPIEVAALAEVFADVPAPVWLGSVKSNIGHTEGAAGIASVIKTVLAMTHGSVPPTLHATPGNPHIPWDDLPFRLPTSVTPWPASRPYAGVSSFGMSGTNAHVVLGPPPSRPTPAAQEALDDPGARAPRLLLLSARTPEALARTVGRYADAVALAESGPESGPGVDDLCRTANTGRSRLAHRVAMVAGPDESLAEVLRERLARPLPEPVRRRGGLAMMFTGQGSTWPAMGAELHRTHAAFRTAFDEVAEHVRAAGGPDLAAEVLGGTGALVRTDVAQPAILAVELGLAGLWRSWGVVPTLVLGHSVGEVAAATLAGVLTTADAARFVVERGRLMNALPAGGVMTAVRCDEVRSRAAIAGLDDVAIAAVNGPTDVVLSGSELAVQVAERRLAAGGVGTTRLTVSHAFHSPLMRPVHDEVMALAASLALRPAQITLVDNLTAAVDPGTLTDPAYFGRHLLGTVRFADSVERALSLGVDTLLEVGPKPVLTAAVSRWVEDADGTRAPLVTASLREGSALRSMLDAAAALVESGVEVELDQISDRGRRAAAPTYPFEHTQHRVVPAAPRRPAVRGAFSSLVRAPGAGGAVLAEALLTPATADLTDHRIDGRVVAPAALHLALLVDLATAGGDADQVHLTDVVFPAPLVIETDEAPLVAALVPAQAGTELTCSVTDPASGTTTLHAVASLARPDEVDGVTGLGEVVDLADPALEEVGVEALYGGLDGSGLRLGDGYRRLVRLRRAHDLVVGDLEAGPEERAPGVPASGHPGVLDAAFQLVEALRASEDTSLRLPFRLDRFSARPDALHLAHHAVAQRVAGEVRVSLLDASGAVVLVGEGFVDAEVPEHVADPLRDAWLQRPTWVEIEPPAPSTAAVALVGEGSDARELARLLADDGVPVTVHDAPGPMVLAAEGPRTVLVVAERDDALVPVLERVAALVRLFDEWADPPRVRLVSWTAAGLVGDPRSSALAALARTAALEHPGVDCRAVALDAWDERARAWLTSDRAGLPDVVLQHGVALAREHEVLRELGASRPRALALTSYGGPDAVAVVPAQTRPLGAGEVRVDVVASGVNFRDVLISLGMLAEADGVLGQDPGRESLGFECAGIIAEVGPDVADLRVGDRVAGLGEGTHADQAVVAASQVVRVPPEIDLVTAAALPMAFLTAAHAFAGAGGLRPSSTVLVHSVTGGVGQAAARLALAQGARVHGTASPAKHAVARAMGLAGVHDSRSTSFADDVLGATDGRGVDVVVNSLTGPAIDAGLRCVAAGGTFVEIGRVGAWTAEQVSAVRPDVRYVRFDLGDEAAADPTLVHRLFAPVLADVAQGRLDPLPVRAFALEEGADALRFMQRARHVGKLVLTAAPLAGPRAPGGAGLVSGGLGALGLHAAQVLAERGVERLVLLGRSGPSPSALARIEDLRARGVDVLAVTGDVTREDDVRRALGLATADGTRLTAVVHAAGVLDDGLLRDLDESRSRAVTESKIVGVAALDRLTRPLRPDHFVMFSSVAAHVATGGQVAYAAANAWLDGVARVRRAEGLPALSVAWGPWQGEGMAAGGRFARTIPAEAGRALLDRLLDAGAALPPTVVVDVEHLLLPSARVGESATAPVPRAGVLAHVLDGATPNRRRGLVVDHLRTLVRAMAGLAASHPLDDASVLAEVGVDSLMLVELRRSLRQDLGVAVAASMVFDHPTIGDLAEALLDLVDAELPAVAAPESVEPGPVVLDDADELRRLLDLELDDAVEER